MKITQAEWNDYINKLSTLSQKASDEFKAWANRNGGWHEIDRQLLLEAGYSFATKYAEGSAALASAMYDAIADAEKKNVPSAELSADIEFKEMAKAINGALKHSDNDDFISSTVGRAVKQSGADTMLKNASRDGAEFAWIPSGDTCPFCLVLASRGWQKASKKTANGNHAEHIHTNCNCQFAIRFNKNTNVEGYDPEEYQKMYYEAAGNTPKEKINTLRAKQRAEKAKELAKLSQNDKIIIERMYSEAKGYADDKFDRKTQLFSHSEDIAAVNPNLEKSDAYKENCQRCCPTYLLRLQGYDVIANPDGFGNDENVNYLLRRAQHVKYVKADGSHPMAHLATKSTTHGKAEIEEFMKDLPDGAIVEIGCMWNPKKVSKGGGHDFIGEKVDGVVKYYDPQNGETDVSRYFDDMIEGRTTFIRIDDTKVNEDYLWYIARNNR